MINYCLFISVNTFLTIYKTYLNLSGSILVVLISTRFSNLIKHLDIIKTFLFKENAGI